MQVSTSILAIKENLNEKIKKLEQTSTDYIHLDVMDHIFVDNESDFSNLDITIPKDVHLMVEDVKKYVEIYKDLNPTYITFHYEVKDDVSKLISYIKNYCKVGLSIKPNTKVEEIIPYLSQVDLVLVMSVEPGYGGQEFLDIAIDKVNKLKKLRDENNYNYLIEVDGGINLETSKLVHNADILVSGSYITNAVNYQEKIQSLKEGI